MTKTLLPQLFSGAVRNIPPKERGNRGFFPSTKVINGVVEYESQIERDFFILLDHADDVEIYQHQPVIINYLSSDKKQKKYTPDVYVKFSNGLEVIVEIKDEKTFQENQNDYYERWNACTDWCEKRGYSFIVLTEIDIRTARYTNVWFTLGPSKVVNNNQNMKKVNRMIPKCGIEYNSLCYMISDDLGTSLNKASQIVSYGIYHGQFFVDSFSKVVIDKNTLIRPGRQSINNYFTPYWMELDEILANRDGEIKFRVKKDSIVSIEENTSLEFKNKDPKLELAVKEFLATPSNKRDIEWRIKLEIKYGFKKSKIYYWVKRYTEEGLSGLERKHHNAGRKNLWDGDKLEQMEIARKAYLHDNLSVKQAYNLILLNNWKSDDKVPSYSSFWRYLKKKNSYYESEISRKGKRRVMDLKPSLGTFQGAIAPMQVLQFDNTSFDLFLKEEEYNRSIGTPNLCAAIDVFTRQITGFELTLNAINKQSILETLVQSIMPKTRYLEIMFEEDRYTPDWNIEGFPVLILVDNGMDYRSNDLKQFCMKYNIILEFAPLRNPRYKAYIEGWFKILNIGISNELVNNGFRPGLIHRLENPDIDPERTVLYNIQESEKWLLSWILDEYHLNNPYNDGLPAPTLRLSDYKKGLGRIILPQPRDPPIEISEYNDLLINALSTDLRVLKSNIEFSNLRYTSKSLINLFKKFGKINVKILYDVRDIRSIWVVHPVTSNALKLHLSNGWGHAFMNAFRDMPVSKSFWSKEVSRIRKNNRNKLNLKIFRKETGRTYRNEMYERATSKRENRDKAIIKENGRKLKTKPHHQRLIEGDEKKVIEIDDEGKFVRKYVPIPDSVKKNLDKRRKRQENQSE